MNLTSLGWDARWASLLDGSAGRPARVLADPRGPIHVHDGEAASTVAVPHTVEPRPVVGDWVLVEGAQVLRVLPRRTALIRGAAGATGAQVLAANVDTVLIATSLNDDFNPRRIERTLLAVAASGARPVVVLTKADLVVGNETRFVRQVSAITDAPVVLTSAVLPGGMDALWPHLQGGTTAVLLGSSGVGKSSISNALGIAAPQEVTAIRKSDQRGQHTTTTRALFELPHDRGNLIDTPGIRELRLWVDAPLDSVFQDIESLAHACRYRDCGHEGEPGCAVGQALEAGTLPPERLESWRKLGRELERIRRREAKGARETVRRRAPGRSTARQRPWDDPADDASDD